MKRFFFKYFFLVFVLCGVASAQEIPAPQDPPRLVNDFAKQLNTTEVQALEQKLVAYNDSTSSQVTIVTVPTTQPYTIDEYAFKILRSWGVGEQGKDNGIVLLWAPDDRKVFIATGYGMEGVIPDVIAKRIISQIIIPDFKNGMYYRGLDKGVEAIFKYASGEYKAEPKESEDGNPIPFVIFLFIFILILIFITRNRGGGKGGRGFRNSGPVFWPYSTFSGSGHSNGDWGGGGFGGGFGGGGFGGFGGGSGGGGGAGGSY